MTKKLDGISPVTKFSQTVHGAAPIRHDDDCEHHFSGGVNCDCWDCLSARVRELEARVFYLCCNANVSDGHQQGCRFGAMELALATERAEHEKTKFELGEWKNSFQMTEIESREIQSELTAELEKTKAELRALRADDESHCFELHKQVDDLERQLAEEKAARMRLEELWDSVRELWPVDFPVGEIADDIRNLRRDLIEERAGREKAELLKERELESAYQGPVVWSEERQQWEPQRVQAEAAAMREALEHQTGEECGTYCCEEGLEQVEKALSSTAGKEMFERLKDAERSAAEWEKRFGDEKRKADCCEDHRRRAEGAEKELCELRSKAFALRRAMRKGWISGVQDFVKRSIDEMIGPEPM